MLGRPCDYTPEIAERICVGLMEGRSLRKICLADDMPHQSTVCRWLLKEENADFREQYARAREFQGDALFDEALDIADDGSNDWMADKDEEAGTDYNGDAVQRSRLRVETRKWMAAKLRPKKYGDKLELAGDANSPLQVVINKPGG